MGTKMNQEPLQLRATLAARPPRIILRSQDGDPARLLSIRGVLQRYNGARREDGGWSFPYDTGTFFALEMEMMSRGIVLEFATNKDRERFAMLSDWRNKILSGVKEGDPKAEAMLRSVAVVKSKTDPFPHQRLGTNFLIYEERALLADDMGLGKTKQAIDAACNLPEQPDRIVILCPKSLMRNWKNEIEMHAEGDNLVYLLGSSNLQQREKELERFQMLASGYRKWLIVNYEKCRAKKAARTPAIATGESEAIAKTINSFNCVLICDEAHRLKSGQAQQSIWVREMVRPLRLWFLSGTPIANRLEDVWHITRCIQPGRLGWYFYDFDRNHVVRNKWGGVDSFKDVETIREALASYSFGRKKESVLNLPPIMEEVRYVTLSPEERRPYVSMEKNLVAWLEANGERAFSMASSEGQPNFATRFLRLRQILAGFVSESADGPAIWVENPSKIRELVEVWQDAGQPRAIAWCHFRAVIDRVCQALRPVAAAVWAIDGRVAQDERDIRIDKWRATEGSVLVCQMDTAGEGLNLHAASWQAFLEQPTTPKQRAQCTARLHRIGQTSTVTTVHILAEKTVDEKIEKTLRRKLKEAGEAEEGTFTQADMARVLRS